MRLGRWLERTVLKGFDPDEIEDITHDLRDLSATRGRAWGVVYYWGQLTMYPVRRAIDALRHAGGTTRDDGRRGGKGSWVKDTRYALRTLMRNPGFTGMAPAIMAVSMGAATAIFSVVDGVLLEPLPVEEPDRLVSLWLENSRGQRRRMTPGNFVDIRETGGMFEHVAAYGAESASLSTDAEPILLRGSRVSPAYFETLGVQPAMGRTFREEEGELGAPNVVVLSHHVWQQMFGSDPLTTRHSVTLDAVDYQIVGVAPRGIFPTRATVSAEIPFTTSNQDFFVPMRYGPDGWVNRRSHILGMIGRLAPTVEPEAARDRLAALSADLQITQPFNEDEHVLMTSFTEEVVGEVRYGLITLLGTVGLVLLISVVNVGALFVLRADYRQPQLAIRVALGAPRGRLVRQMILESAIISGGASLGAIILARIAIGVMRGLVPYQIPRLADVTVHGPALLVTIAVGLLAACAFGLTPAVRLSQRRLNGPVARNRQTSGVRQRRLQGTVVAVQAGLCIVVLVGAALLSRSYAELRAVDKGFDAENAWTMSIPAPLPILNEIVEGVRGLPGVASAAIAYDHPLQRTWGDGFQIEGVEQSASDPPWSASLRPFGDGYFATVGIDVREGRVPDRVDMAGDVGYAVINETFARTFFPEGSAIGSRLVVPTAQLMLGTDGLFEILGIVGDVRFHGPDQPVGPALYVPLSHFDAGASNLMVLPARGETSVLRGVRTVVAGIDPSLGVYQPRRLGDILDDLLARPRFNMMLLVSFATIGLILCGLGVYGLVGRTVATRVREIGIQMALGADRARLARAIIRSALRPMIFGCAIGLAAASGLTRLIESLLFGISAADPMSFAASPAFVIAIGFVAAFVPTLRAVSINPASMLRAE